MSDTVKLIIELPKEDFKKLVNPYQHNEIWCNRLKRIVMHGIPLPKGHGRLIDADVLCDYFWDNRSKLYTCKDLQIVIDKAQPIIEADKAESEGV